MRLIISWNAYKFQGSKRIKLMIWGKNFYRKQNLNRRSCEYQKQIRMWRRFLQFLSTFINIKVIMGRKREESEEQYKVDRRQSRRATERRYLRWSSDENKDYVKFLMRNMELMKDDERRKNSTIFIKMSEQLKNGRDNHQCRSHHMKLLLKYKSINNIIEELTEKVKIQRGQEQVGELEKQGKTEVPIVYEQRQIFTQYDLKSQMRSQQLNLFNELAGPTFAFP